MLRLEFAGRKVYHGGNFSNIFKSVFCGAVSHFAVGQLWHTNQLFRVLCASQALSLKSVAVNFGTQIGLFGFCVPAGRCLSSRSRSTLAHKSAFSSFVCQSGAVSQVSRGQLWHTNRLFRVLCARPALPPGILEGKNEKFLAHKSPKLEIVCHSSSIPPKK